MNYQTTYADGSSDNNSDSLGGALRCVANRYDVAVDDLWTSTKRDRILVWLDEDSAQNYDGQPATAEIREIK